MWALGCVLYELCIGKRPFDQDYDVKQYGSGLKGPEEYRLELIKVPAIRGDRPRESADLNVIRETIEGPVNNALKGLLAVDIRLRPSAAVMAECLPHKPVEWYPEDRSRAVRNDDSWSALVWNIPEAFWKTM
jgi:serine/threonine protein kinase